MLSVAVVLLPTKSEKLFSLNIRVTKDRKSKYHSLGYKVSPEQFKEGGNQHWVVKHPDAVFINREIEEKRKRGVAAISAAEIANTDISLEEVIAIVKGNKEATVINSSFLTAVEQRSLYHFANEQISDYYRFKRYKKYLEDAWQKDYSIDKITLELAQGYHLYRKAAGAGNNTIRKELDDLGSIIKRKLPGATNPFKDHRRSIMAVPVKKHKLTKPEIKLIEEVPVKGFPLIAKHMWLFSYYTQGMRFENVALLEREKIKKLTIDYQMNKGKKHKTVSLHPKLVDIINIYKNNKTVYLFPVVKAVPVDAWDKRSKIGVASADVNDALKIVAATAGLTVNLTFHLARHSFANNARKGNVDLAFIQAALGHSSEKTTKMYIDSLDDEAVSNAVRVVYD